jgi:anti-sigma B factor antagonist
MVGCFPRVMQFSEKLWGIHLITMSSSIVTIQPSGVIDATIGREVRQAILEAADAGATIVLIDCQNVNFIDSSGLGALVAAFKSVNPSGVKLSFCAINQQIRMLFELTSLDQIFEILPDPKV